MSSQNWRLISLGPRLLYRLGLGSVIGRKVLMLTTTGRKTGKPHTVPLQYEQIDGDFYVASARGQEADWYKNIAANPRVAVAVGSRRLSASARIIADHREVADFLEYRMERHPRMVGAIMRGAGMPHNPNRAELEAYARRRALVCIVPKDEGHISRPGSEEDRASYRGSRMPEDNYVGQSARLLREFDKSISPICQTLEGIFGRDQAALIIEESRAAYEILIPQIPYLGRKNRMLIFLHPAVRQMALFKTLLKHGCTVEEAGEVILEMGNAAIMALPFLYKWAIQYVWFSPWFLGRLRSLAIKTQERKYPDGYVMHFVDGDGHSFSYGIDYSECASLKFLKAQGMEEMAPYVCAVDKVASEVLGWGLSRTMTLAGGCDRCDFRFTKGGETRVSVPPTTRPREHGRGT